MNLNEIKSGKNIILDGSIYTVLYHEHSKTGRAGAVLRTKLRNLSSGATMEKTFQGSEQVQEADIAKSKAQYTYRDSNDYYFMDSETYDQFTLSREVLGDNSDFLKEGTEITLLNFEGNPINIELPIKVKLKVIEAPPNVKGNSASSPSKVVTLETGLKINAPIFIKNGDEIIVNTQKREYVGRV
jgi:elongation factor P